MAMASDVLGKSRLAFGLQFISACDPGIYAMQADTDNLVTVAQAAKQWNYRLLLWQFFDPAALYGLTIDDEAQGVYWSQLRRACSRVYRGFPGCRSLSQPLLSPPSTRL